MGSQGNGESTFEGQEGILGYMRSNTRMMRGNVRWEQKGIHSPIHTSSPMTGLRTVGRRGKDCSGQSLLGTNDQPRHAQTQKSLY